MTQYAGAVLGLALVFLLLWNLREVLLMAFGALLVAIVIRSGSGPLERRTGLSERWSVALVALVLFFGLFGIFWLFGQQITSQLRGLTERLPQAAESIEAWMRRGPTGQWLLEQATGLAAEATWLEKAPQILAVSVASIGHFFLMLVAGVYLAMNPKLYLSGVVRLIPPRRRPLVRASLLDTGEALQRWLLGQFVSMSSVGVLTGLGLWAVGAPLPLGLGILAGLLEFVPVIGPLLAFVPGVLVALTEGPDVAVRAAVVFVVVQQLEGSVIMPLAQRWAVELPPAFGLFAVLSFSLLFGFLGVLFGSPLAVATMLLVRKLYVEAGLESAVAAPKPAG